MDARKHLTTAFLGAMLAAWPVLASSAIAERDDPQVGVSVTMYDSTDCSGKGSPYDVLGNQTVS